MLLDLKQQQQMLKFKTDVSNLFVQMHTLI